MEVCVEPLGGVIIKGELIRIIPPIARLLHTTELDTVVARVAVMAMKFMISDAHVRSHQSVAEAHVTHATFETLHVIEQS